MVQDTSILAYRELINSGLLNEQEQEVFRAFLTHGPSSDKEIEKNAGIDLNIINGRRNDLITKGYMKDCGTRPCKETGNTVHFWYVCKPDDIKNFVPEESDDPVLMSAKEMNKIYKIVRCANDFQKKQIIEWCQ